MRLIQLLAALLLATFPAMAAPKTQPQPPSPLAPAMWEVSDEDTRITLFGTIHALPRDVGWFGQHVVAALDNADQLVLEAIQPQNGAVFTATIRRMAHLRTPRPLVARVPAKEQPALKAALDRLNPPSLEWYKDWYVALTLANLDAQANGFDPRIGVEAVLTERAKLKNIPVSGLETMEQQLVYFDALAPADQKQILLTTIQDIPDSKERTEAMLRAWLQGDIDSLASQLNEGFRRSPMLKRMLVDDRNERWAYWIARQLRETPGHIFLAVGAGHFAGPGNLLEALKPHGIEAKRVTDAPPPK